MATPLPPTLKPINSFLKLAKEYDKRDATVSYFCRMYAVQKGIKVDSKSPDCKKFLFGLMDQLEMTKKEITTNGDESVTNDIVGQAHLENVAVDLFSWADGEDRKGAYNKNVVKAFYSSSLLFEVLTQFGELSDECKVQQRYAKWKATEIHRCMLNGETPKPGPAGSEFEDEFAGLSIGGPSNVIGASGGDVGATANISQPPQPPMGFSYTQPGVAPIPAPRRPSQPTATSTYVEDTTSVVSDVGGIDFAECSKYCKYAMSALNYEDVDTAVDNLTKALNMLKAAKR